MNQKININDPAYPTIEQGGNLTTWSTVSGMTIRQQFAMSAMIGLISNAPDGHLSNSREGSQLAVQWADELINALNEEK